jgi:hypothetical protein
MNTRAVQILIVGFALSACGQKPSEPAPEPQAPAPAAPADTAHEAHAAAPPPAAELPAVPAGAKVMFKEPADGAKVQGPLENGKVSVHVQMGADGIAIKPAGAVEAGSGHHHVLVDVEPEAMGAVVPKDEQHLHFGQGQTEATLLLSPGEHTLRLQLADGIHRSYGPQLSASIKITVAAAGSVGTPPAEKPTPRAPVKIVP